MTDKDACELLDADHIAVKHLFADYARLAFGSPEGSADQRTELASRICDELTIHATIEEEIFYPALRQAVPETASQLDHAREEHQEAKDLVAQIRALPAAGPEMDDLVARLASSVEHHVKEERDKLFPKARASDRLDLAALGGRLRERQDELQGAPA